MTRESVILYLNGEKKEILGDAAFYPLSRFLREDQSLSGTKIVCAEGDCGACTVLVDRGEGFISVNSCIMPVALLDGAHVVTVEGLSVSGSLTEVQEKMIEHHGGQCGFCTPGFVMVITGLFENCTKNESPSEKKIKNCLTGNLCRCTGYAPIIEAAQAVSPSQQKKLSARYSSKKIFENLKELTADSFEVEDSKGELVFLGPKSINEALEIKTRNPNTRIYGSATDLGVQFNKNKLAIQSSMSLKGVKELQEIQIRSDSVSIGACATLDQIEKALESRIPEFSKFLHIFASPQIKNVATLTGNLVNASPIADTVPFLMVMNASVKMRSQKTDRKVSVNQFFKGYKKIDLKSDELVTAIEFNQLPSDSILKLYKVSQRRDLDISTVNAAFLIKLNGDQVETIRIAYGGVGPTALRLTQTEQFLTGKILDSKTQIQASQLILSEISPQSDLRASQKYREVVSQNLFKKFCHELLNSTPGQS